MNDVLLLIGLAAVLVGAAGVVRPQLLLRRRRFSGSALLLAGVLAVVTGMSRSDDGSLPGAEHMLLDELMPTYDAREIHAIRIHASPEQIFSALRNLTIDDLGVANVLTWIRSLPARLSGKERPAPRASRPLLRFDSDSSGFFMLAEDPNREWVAGFIGQFWKPTGGSLHPISAPAEFLSFDDPNHAKAAWNFYVEPKGDGSCRLSTETRVLGTDTAGTRNFKVYWTVIRPGSAFLRRALLKAVKHRAEASSPF